MREISYLSAHYDESSVKHNGSRYARTRRRHCYQHNNKQEELNGIVGTVHTAAAGEADAIMSGGRPDVGKRSSEAYEEGIGSVYLYKYMALTQTNLVIWNHGR
ncbi:hypothetical protein AVEN_269381-1 [Araneus ventricosus]|uniref:Uncharacterized protein n=1 Tax=Araneus ventricosus TaxID=182803 RepID=A0A4Y2VK67_ARAVE|nr:hypothetical protein AVEN_269381-1 [Araneus ventricosus]